MDERDDEFAPVRAVARLLSGFDRPWFVAGGWAIDLFLGERTRPHSDVEVALFRDDQRAIRSHLDGWEFRVVEDGDRRPWDPDEYLELPVHELHAHRREGRSEVDELEVLLNEYEDGAWVYRRDPRIERVRERFGRTTAQGVPCLAPEVVLLYKTPIFGDHDHEDFETAVEHLASEPLAWLRGAIETIDPDHPCLASL